MNRQQVSPSTSNNGFCAVYVYKQGYVINELQLDKQPSVPGHNAIQLSRSMPLRSIDKGLRTLRL